MDPWMICVCCELYGPLTTIKCSKLGGMRSPPRALQLKVTRNGSSRPTEVLELRAVSCTSWATRLVARNIKAQSQWYLPIFFSTLFLSFRFFSGHFFCRFLFRTLYRFQQTFDLLWGHLSLSFTTLFRLIFFTTTVFILRFALVVLLLVLRVTLIALALLVVLWFVLFTFVVLRVLFLLLVLIVFRIFFILFLFLFLLLVLLLLLIFLLLLLF